MRYRWIETYHQVDAHVTLLQWCKASWWRHQMETLSALLALCAGNSPVTGEFPTQRPVTRSFDVFFDQRMNKLLSKQSWGWRFETPSVSLWRHCNDDTVFKDSKDFIQLKYDQLHTSRICGLLRLTATHTHTHIYILIYVYNLLPMNQTACVHENISMIVHHSVAPGYF